MAVERRDACEVSLIRLVHKEGSVASLPGLRMFLLSLYTAASQPPNIGEKLYVYPLTQTVFYKGNFQRVEIGSWTQRYILWE